MNQGQRAFGDDTPREPRSQQPAFVDSASRRGGVRYPPASSPARRSAPSANRASSASTNSPQEASGLFSWAASNRLLRAEVVGRTAPQTVSSVKASGVVGAGRSKIRSGSSVSWLQDKSLPAQTAEQVEYKGRYGRVLRQPPLW